MGNVIQSRINLRGYDPEKIGKNELRGSNPSPEGESLVSTEEQM